MNWAVLRLLFLHELRMLVRARRTVVMALVLPALIMPLMLYAQKYSLERRERLLSEAVYRFAITGESAERFTIIPSEQPVDGMESEAEDLARGEDSGCGLGADPCGFRA